MVMSDTLSRLSERGLSLPGQIIKRNGSYVDFDLRRVERAVRLCYESLDEHPQTPIIDIVTAVANTLASRRDGNSTAPSVEEVQDIVEIALLAAGEFDAARSYMVYRELHGKLRTLIPEEVKQAFEQDKQYFPTPLQQFMYFDKYSRFNWNLGRRETWKETVDRAVDYLHHLAGDRLDSGVYERIHRSILTMRTMPSMRLLAMAGPAAIRNSLSIYNCSALPVTDTKSFVEALLISFAGCGVGFSVERDNVEQFPRIKRQTGKKEPTWYVEDSSEGWGDALQTGLDTWFDGRDIDFDYSFIRKAGTPLRTKGGTASGPEPLKTVLEFCRSKVLSRQGSFLRTLDAHDMMCVVGGAAVSGGVRRTAEISLFDFDDQEMRTCKDGAKLDQNPHRWNANNSAVWPEDISQIQLVDQMAEMYRNHRGEPGIFSRFNANLTKPDRRKSHNFLTNPCLTGETLVMTANGPQRIDSLVDAGTWAVVDGKAYPTTKSWSNGVKPVFKLATREGYSLRLTEDHKVLRSDGVMVPAMALVPGDAIALNNHRGIPEWAGLGTEDEGYQVGMFKGDGTAGQGPMGGYVEGGVAVAKVWSKDEGSETVADRLLVAALATGDRRSDFAGWRDYGRGTRALTLDKRILERFGVLSLGKPLGEAVEMTSAGFHRGFLQAFFDCDGHVESYGEGFAYKGTSVRLSQSDRGALEVVQRMLLRFGIKSQIYHSRSAGLRLMPDGRGGKQEYFAKTSWRLVVSADSVPVFADQIGFCHRAKSEKLNKAVAKKRFYSKPFVATVESLVPDGDEIVYDLSVANRHAIDANGIVVSNCGEILLKNWGLCNLSIAVARSSDDYQSLKDKVEIATIIGTIQSMATTFPGMRPEWKKNCEEERLLGVDVSGQQDCPAVQDAKVLDALKQVAIRTNQEYADRLGINRSAAITCNKPNGNSSQLLDCASGIHARWAPYYIRNVRVSPHTPIFRVLRNSKVPMDPENGQTPQNASSWVVHFPVKAPEGAKTRRGYSAIDQCEYWLLNKVHWTEHNPSVTITYQPDELLDLMKWVWEHRTLIGGMSFLPADDAKYAQMPYEEISKETYDKLIAEFPEIDFSLLFAFEQSDETEAAQTVACTSGQCEL